MRLVTSAPHTHVYTYKKVDTAAERPSGLQQLDDDDALIGKK